MAVSISPQAAPRRPLVPGLAWWPLALTSCVVVAILTIQSIHWGAAAVSVAAVVCIHLRSRAAGLAGVWLLWLLLPGARRLLGLAEGFFVNADPLALAPFAATGIVGAVELSRARLGRRGKWVLGAAVIGFLFGAPMGLLTEPLPALYAACAYVGAVLAFAAGYREPATRALTLYRTLAIAGVPIAAYAVLQILAPLTPWDALWLGSVEFTSIGNKEEGTLRAFGTLNSPATLAAVLGLAVLGLLSARRFGLLPSAALLVVLAGVALTLVRSVWLALGLTLVLMVLVSPVRVTRRVLVVAVLGVAVFPFVGAGSPVTSTVGERATTLTDVEGDTSAQERVNTPKTLGPMLIRDPLGFGLGTAGEANRLGSGGGLRATDNAFLALLIQNGGVGLVLVFGAAAAGFVSALRNVRRERTTNDLAVVAGISFVGALAIAGDVFYGVTGAAFWYLIGFAVRRDERAGDLSGA